MVFEIGTDGVSIAETLNSSHTALRVPTTFATEIRVFIRADLQPRPRFRHP